MATKSIAWNTGNGNIILTYNGQGDGTIKCVSDENNLFTPRSKTINVTGGNITREFTVSQPAAIYRLIEWVENTNSNVLNFTDILPNDDHWEFFGKVIPIFVGSYETIISAYTSEQNNCYRIIRANNSNTDVYINANSKAGGGTITAANVISSGNPIEFHIKSGKATINEKNFTLSNTKGNNLTNTIQINRGRWYGLTIYHNGTMIRSYHPCVNANGKYGLVDVLTDTIKYPSNGTFNSGGNPITRNFRDNNSVWFLTADGKFYNVKE